MRMAPPEVGGHMPPEVIQRVVRQNFGRMRMCYEQGLGRNPNLEGRVEVRFLIGSDGRVGSASSGSSSMPDSAVTSCVVSVFYAISFPAPESGTVRVTYPISFTPS
jgi:TonB family protein